MAKIDGKFIRGLVGDSVCRELNGEQIIQLAPRVVNRTKGSILAGKVFGFSSQLGFAIRKAFADLINDQYSSYMSVNLNAQLLASLNSSFNKTTKSFKLKKDSFKNLPGFEFNSDSKVSEHLFVQPKVTEEAGLLHIDIPMMHLPEDFIFPKNITTCKIIIGMLLIDIKNGRYNVPDYQTVEVIAKPRTSTIPASHVSFETKPGCLCLVGISLRYYKQTFIGDTYINSKKFNPTAILSATLVPGSPGPGDKNWLEIDFKERFTVALPSD